MEGAMNDWRFWVIVTVASCAACGGGGYVVPVEHASSARTAIAVARNIGAGSDRQAAFHLAVAERQYAAACTLMHEGHDTQGDWMLLRAQADAELAKSLAGRTFAAERTREAIEQVRAFAGQSTPSQEPAKE
jgi:hypothetical protein